MVDVIDSVTSKKRIRRNREGVGMKASGLALCLFVEGVEGRDEVGRCLKEVFTCRAQRVPKSSGTGTVITGVFYKG